MNMTVRLLKRYTKFSIFFGRSPRNNASWIRFGMKFRYDNKTEKNNRILFFCYFIIQVFFVLLEILFIDSRIYYKCTNVWFIVYWWDFDELWIKFIEIRDFQHNLFSFMFFYFFIFFFVSSVCLKRAKSWDFKCV